MAEILHDLDFEVARYWYRLRDMARKSSKNSEDFLLVFMSIVVLLTNQAMCPSFEESAQTRLLNFITKWELVFVNSI